MPSDWRPTAERGGPAGLCESCAHRHLVRNTRGSVFSLCLLSRSDGRFPRYPRLPVTACAGHQPREPLPGGGDVSR
jgi:hypothetical protein